MSERREPWEDPDEEVGLPEEEPLLGGLGEGLDQPSLKDYPGDFKQFTTTTPEFQELGPMPLGSVITMTWSDDAHRTPGLVALMVTGCDFEESGVWLDVKLLGADTEWARKLAISQFSRKKLQVHCCFDPDRYKCLQADEAFHITEFGYWPPGNFKAAYVDRSKMSMMGKYLEELKGPPTGEKGDPGKTTPDRLAALRQRLISAKGREGGGSPSVSFQSGSGLKSILRRPAPPSPSVKREVATLVVSSDSEAPRPKKKTKRDQGVGSALYAAVEQRQLLDRKTGAEISLASSSKRKKKKKGKKKKRKDSSSGSSSSSEGSSSDELKPPLQKKAERRPGSVLKMLMDHVRLSLSDLSLGHPEEGGAGSSVTSTARVQSYFQILVRPQLHNRQRDEKELFSLALGLDLLRQGQIEKVADLMVGRYIAVETAALTRRSG